MRILPLFVVLALAGAAVEPPPAVMALGGAVTETVFALGAGDALVGSDQTSLYPPAALHLPKVGYVRALGAEGILSLMPRLVLASADAGPPAALARVANAGVTVLTLREAHTPEAALARVHDIGAALGRAPQADMVQAALAADLAQVQADVAATKDRPRVLFLLSVGRGAPMGAGRDTAADAMITLAGGVNAVAETVLYRPVSAEAVLLAAPDVIVITSDAWSSIGGIEGLRALPGLAATPALQNNRVYAFDALFLLSFGPRLALAMHDLAGALHPQAMMRDLPHRAWTDG